MRSVYRISEFAERVALPPRQELVEGPLAMVRAFSWRLDGLRPREEELDADLTVAGDR